MNIKVRNGGAEHTTLIAEDGTSFCFNGFQFLLLFLRHFYPLITLNLLDVDSTAEYENSKEYDAQEA